MPASTLTQRALNRATLARQRLLERAMLSATEALEQLAGLQAQMALSPYVGLWTRLAAFTRADLAHAIEARQVVKATLMRATLHLVTAADYCRFRATLQPALNRAAESISKQRPHDGLDLNAVIARVREYLKEHPRTFAEISAMLTEWQPTYDVGLMRYTARTHLPLVQVPVTTSWSYPGNPQFALADDWLGTPIPDEDNLPLLIRRYLAAFGPASVTDMQTWSGLHGLKSVVQQMKDELVSYRDERGRELFDLPDQPLPAGDSPAPPRFLPEFDNLLLAHDKRERIIADEYRKRVYLPGLRVAATFLIDGFVAGVWKIEKVKGTATLHLEPFTTIPAADRQTLTEEAERLVRFAEPDAKAHAVQVAG